MVQLKEFVRSTLVQVAEGVKQAQEEAGRLGARVNPTGLSGDVKAAMYDEDYNIARLVEFDVAVEATEETASKGGIGVVVAAIGFGTQHRAEESSSALSRVKFSVPILLPPGRDNRA